MLSDEEIDVIEKILGKDTLYLFNKTWDERNNLRNHLVNARIALEKCKKEKRVETKYWEAKIKEMNLVDAHQRKTLLGIVHYLKGKVEPQFYRKIFEVTGLDIFDEDYPNCVKEREHADEWNAIAPFIEYLGEKRIILAEWVKFHPELDENLQPVSGNLLQLFHGYIGVDTYQLEMERRRLLDEFRKKKEG